LRYQLIYLPPVVYLTSLLSCLAPSTPSPLSLTLPRPPSSTLFPYTTLFRSRHLVHKFTPGNFHLRFPLFTQTISYGFKNNIKHIDYHSLPYAPRQVVSNPVGRVIYIQAAISQLHYHGKHSSHPSELDIISLIISNHFSCSRIFGKEPLIYRICLTFPPKPAP